MDLDPVQAAVAVTAIIAALVAIGKLVQTLSRGGRKIARVLDEIIGEPAEYGRPARPGLIEKVDTVVGTQGEHTDELAAMRAQLELVRTDELAAMRAQLELVTHELFPNSGLSMRDAVDRTERALSDHVEQSKSLLEAGKGTEQELRKAISDIAAALPTIAESTPPEEPR